ncbi:hypothetical protein [Halorussus halophilus]|uniref:hypothetical protein n=1 Tax=Halorussus halophilus TaxID=2650975 RepID=UPI001300D6C9|nr:hypothetical protein [Halorussus halophilus]
MEERDEQGNEEPMTPTEFRTELADLLRRGSQGEISFDRAWTFRDSQMDIPDWMVEITELQKCDDD